MVEMEEKVCNEKRFVKTTTALSKSSPDCLLVCGSEKSEVGCHRALLAAHSPVINMALREIGEEVVDEVILILPDFSHEEVSGVLDVMYGEKVEITVSHDLMKALKLDAHATLAPTKDSKSETVVTEDELKETSMSFECPECHQLLPDLAALYSHLEVCEASAQEGKPRQTYFKCSPCSKVFGSIGEINAHVREEHVGGRKQSKVIEREGVPDQEDDGDDVGIEQIEETIITVGGDDRITVETMTAQETPEPLSISFPSDIVEAEGYDVRYMCSDCDQIFITMLLLEKHRAANHPKLQSVVKYQCNFCRQNFSTTEEHNRHTVSAHNQFIIDQVDQQKNHNFFKCSHCNVTFPVVKDLTEHIVSKHAEEGNTNRRGKASGPELRGRCTICLKSLYMRSELGPHFIENHPDHKPDSYMCNTCNKIFRSVEYLEKHEKVHRDSRPFQCGGCQARFSLASSLHNHVKTCQSIPLNAMNRILAPTKVMEREERVFLCPMCKEEFPSNAAVKLHTKSSGCKEIKLKALPRPIYPKITTNDIVSKLPISRDINNSEIIFQIPDTDFKSSDAFEQSVLEGGESLIFETDTPAPLIETLTNSETSESEPMPEESTLLTAEPYDDQRIVVLDQNGLGPEVLIQSDVLEVEDNSKLKDRKFVCSYCKNRYFARDHLISHMRTHTGEKPFECEKCKEKFMYRSTWSNHRVRCIEGPDGMNKFRKFTCGFCSSSFLARDHLRQHERIHTGEKPWKCAQCSERFQYRNRWKTHVRKCTGSEPVSSKLEEVKNMAHKKHGQFKCTHCDQIFKKTNRLEKHAQSMHPGSKNLTCELCGEKFAFEISLREHIEKHNTPATNEPIMLMMMEGSNIEEEGSEHVQTEVVHTFGQEQVVECETVFPDGFGQEGGGEANVDYFEVDAKEEVLGDVTHVRKSPRKRPRRKSHEGIVTKRQKVV